ncbi:MAG: MFS transporter [Candidatus Acidiferrales bacterium]
MADSGNVTPSSRVAFSHPNFVLLQLARFTVVIGTEMQSVAVGWQILEITRSPLDLGLVGLAQFVPGLLLFLVSGHAADRLNRRRLLIACHLGFAICFALLYWQSIHGVRSVVPIYAVLVLIGVVRSFSGPVTRAILPQVVPDEHFPNAVAWAASSFQAATILGPALGGIVYTAAHGPAAVYATAMASSLMAALFTMRIKLESKPREHEELSLRTVLAGVRYIWRQRIVLGSMSLDLFAVLLGGAVALLPVFADILKTGPLGLGLLRCAPGAGAAIMAAVLAHWPLQRKMGAVLLWCVGAYGVFTILFGLSRSLVFSMAALVLVGATDMVSVIIRATFLQLGTPDEMRGRVNAVDMIFIGSSNQLGQFESGVTAEWWGTVPAVIVGGVGAMVVAGLWGWIFPELRKAQDVRDLRK